MTPSPSQTAPQPNSQACQPTLQDYRCQILENVACGRNLYKMTLTTLDSPFLCAPGQFVMLDLPTEKFFFRRPFSLLSTLNHNTFQLLYKVVGQGTRQMSALQPGNILNVLGPLGKGFQQNASGQLIGLNNTLMIGGGIGIAPLYFALQYTQTILKHHQDRPYCLYGVQNKADLGIEAELNTVFGEAQIALCTDDGSRDFHGNVVQWLQQHLQTLSRFEQAYICGPQRMMEASVQFLQANAPHITLYVSLEEHMPCGTGACTGCVVPRPNGLLPVKTCLEGPVFNAQSLLWPWQTEDSNPRDVSTSGGGAACPR